MEGAGASGRGTMTRSELLWLLLGQARANGFEFRRWFVGRLGLPWRDSKHAVETLASERRYYALLFSHEFAQHFWKGGETMTFLVEGKTFQRARPDGTIATVYRKGYTKRSGRPDAWKYHLKEVAMAEEPLRYMRRYLRVADELDPEPEFDPGEGEIEEEVKPVQALAAPVKKAGRPPGRPGKMPQRELGQ